MNDTLTKQSMNGVLKIGKRGRAKFQFDEADEPFEVDIMAVYDQWCDIDMELRELNEDKKWILPPKKMNEYGQLRLNFVQAVVNDAYTAMQKAVPTIDRAQAEGFIDLIVQEAARLRNFTLQKSDDHSSSPEPMEGTRINFSQ